MAQSTTDKKEKIDLKGVYAPTDDEKEYVTFLQTRKEQMDDSMEYLLNAVDEYAYLYENVSIVDEDGIIATNVPKEIEIVETKTSDEALVMPEGRIIPAGNADVNMVEALSKINESIDIKTNMRLVKIQALIYKNIYGTAILKEYFRVSKRNVKIITDIDEETGKAKWDVENVVEYKDCATKLIDLRNFRVDEDATCMEDANECIEIERITYEEAKANYKDYSNFKFVQKGIMQTRYEWQTVEQRERDTYEHLEKDVEIWHYWRKDTDEYAIIMNGVLLTDVGNPNPYDHKQLPFIREIDHYTPFSFFGKGEVHLIKSLKIEKNVIRNTAKRTGIINASPVVVVPRNVGLDAEDFVFEHGAVWETNTPEAAQATKVLQVQGEIGSLMQVDSKNDEDIMTATGVDSRSLINQASETATKSAIKKESAMKRINFGMSFIENDSIKRQMFIRVKNIQQFYGELDVIKTITVDKNGERKVKEESVPKKVSISGIEFKWGKRESDIDGQNVSYEILEKTPQPGRTTQLEVRAPLLEVPFDIEIIPASSIPFSKAFEQEKAFQILQNLNGNPIVNQVKLIEDFLKAMDKNPNDYVVQPSQLQAAGAPAPQEAQAAQQGGPLPELLQGAQGQLPQ